MKRFRQGYQRRLWQPRPASLRPDFLAQGVRPPRVVWGLQVTALAVLLIGAADLWALRRDAAAESERLGRWERQLKPLAPRVAALSRPASNAAQAGAWRIADALAHPWGALLAATEVVAPAGVQWLAFEHDGERAEVRLEGVSHDPGAALKAVDRLATRPGWSNVVLTRLAPKPGSSNAAAGLAADAVPSGHSMRFEVTARIDTLVPRVSALQP